MVGDNYKQDEDGTKFGCGNWTISRKGIALLVSYMKDICKDEGAARFLAIEGNECLLENIIDNTEKEKKITELTLESQEDIRWCYDYVTEVLTYMVLNKVKKVDAIWV